MLSALVASVLAASPASKVELTVYNQGFALVKETRDFDLKSGIQDVIVTDVAEQIETTSVGIRSVSSPGSFEVLEQNYQYDLINPQKILDKSVGKRITLVRYAADGKTERISGVLLSTPSAGGIVLRGDDGQIYLNPAGEYRVESIPDGLLSTPTLLWKLDSASAGKNTVELSYLTQGMRWNCDYVLNLDQAGKVGDLKGWVTMINNSGATFSNANLKLLAGEVERRTRPRGSGGADYAPAAMKNAAERGFSEEQFSDYHLYTLGRPATVRNNEQKQISLIEVANVQVTKRLVLDPMRNYAGYRASEGEVGTGVMKPQVRIELENTKKNRMGMPLPMGSFKVFQRDSSNSLQLLGEDAIEHTPTDEKISLFVGRAFDIVAERKRTKFEYIRDKSGNIRGVVESFDIELRNRKKTAETVEVIERFWGQWKITASSLPATRPTAEAAVFSVNLAAGEVKHVTFTVENRW